MGAAVFGSLGTAESEELERLLQADPDAARELEELRATRDHVAPRRLGGGLRGDAVTGSRVTGRRCAQQPGQAAGAGAGGRSDLDPALGTGRRRGCPGACRRTGRLGDRPARAWGADGPPGTLGATEPISFTGEPRGVDVDASIVAHTWGTETVMTIDGLQQGAYTVQVVGTGGETVDSGTFIAPAQGITDCRMIAAVVRPEADAIVVSDSDGAVVMSSQLPRTT